MFCEHVEHFEYIRNVTVFWKLFKFEICLKIRIILTNLKTIIKTILKKFNEIN